ncbi:hypothetical protein K5D51_18905, partial [Pseudomonas cichorii]|nr:hypothetical protein [Pseudomonas cichorii]
EGGVLDMNRYENL